MAWINAKHSLPEKEGIYRCICLYFGFKPRKCRFKKEIKTKHEYCPAKFLHRKRVPFVMYWESK